MLTADIDLAGYDWTPLNKFYGSFNGDGHTIRNLYINSASYPVGLFGYVKPGASVTKLGITGNVTTTNKSYGQAGGIAGYMESDTSVTKSWSSVNVTGGKHGGGIAGYTAGGSAITDCYATGTIRTISANECYLGGICGSYFSNQRRDDHQLLQHLHRHRFGRQRPCRRPVPIKRKRTMSTATIWKGTVSGASPKYGITGLGTAKTSDELKALAATLGDSFAEDSENINGGYPILAWQGAKCLSRAT